ncbi:hypothetical protein EIN_226630 [Entamoeba invadens IP1]|uniref:Uncharacterized protein n=1 Tax=Entamoeba invadens IP1 TaxID=370355 RepID=A0A0A1U5Y0_ENTIV|nr:hypothetical protein EIN_226630 [Entamoeba invadens IP1]ELP88280.1 hypothetical protein EIN_226630 [Entamoeba invadens IP1]|eukprot:XP_004255051.1 hypothetical protein EIN_226630 [Entamoeba invadens IP1]
MIRPAKALRTRSQIIGKNEIKVMVVGSAKCGKTTICNTFFETTSSDTTAEAVVCFSFHQRERYVQIDEEMIRVVVSDIVGKQMFYASDNPYTNYDVIIVVFDITDLKSFTDVKSMWLPDISAYSNIDTEVVLVGNKKDLDVDRITPYKTAQEYADEHLCQYYEVTKEDTSDVKMRVLVMGDTGVGKTTFIRKVTYKEPQGHDFKTLVSSRFEMEKLKYLIHLFDYSFYKNLLLSFPTLSRTIEGMVILFDLTNEESFQNVHRIHFLNLSAFTDVTGILIGYKSDLTKERVVKESDAQTLAEWMNFTYMELSQNETTDHSQAIKALAHAVRINRLSIEQSL